ncbi:MAG: hypothetical protein COA79_13490 [Planctomycetota bacterium]|nr:MAG: hypothetical protein COA79_13490 [Planctomycetota bacterium]
MLKKILISVVLIAAIGISIFFILDMKISIGHSKRNDIGKFKTELTDPHLIAIKKSEHFLIGFQESDGYFCKGILAPQPAITCLVLDAFLTEKDPELLNQAFYKKGMKAVFRCKQPDGGFYNSKFLNMANYCTNLAIMTMSKSNPDLYAQDIKKAANFVKSSQLTGQDYAGGFGYNTDSSKADLSNTTASLESLKTAGELDEETKKKAIKFIELCQNNSETNKKAWASNDKSFIYRPGNSKAGEYTENGQKRYRGYGLMTYAGILSMIYADLGKDDPRVKGAMEWVSKNFNLTNNVNLGQKGLYYYYVTMAKALDAYGQEKIFTDDGNIHYWAKEMIDVIISKQRKDGGFKNTKEDMWLEGDEVLVTAYMLKTMKICYKNIQKSKSKTSIK